MDTTATRIVKYDPEENIYFVGDCAAAARDELEAALAHLGRDLSHRIAGMRTACQDGLVDTGITELVRSAVFTSGQVVLGGLDESDYHFLTGQIDQCLALPAADDLSDLPRRILESLRSHKPERTALFAAAANEPDGGHWITVNGHHIELDGKGADAKIMSGPLKGHAFSRVSKLMSAGYKDHEVAALHEHHVPLKHALAHAQEKSNYGGQGGGDKDTKYQGMLAHWKGIHQARKDVADFTSLKSTKKLAGSLRDALGFGKAGGVTSTRGLVEAGRKWAASAGKAAAGKIKAGWQDFKDHLTRNIQGVSLKKGLWHSLKFLGKEAVLGSVGLSRKFKPALVTKAWNLVGKPLFPKLDAKFQDWAKAGEATLRLRHGQKGSAAVRAVAMQTLNALGAAATTTGFVMGGPAGAALGWVVGKVGKTIFNQFPGLRLASALVISKMGMVGAKVGKAAAVAGAKGAGKLARATGKVAAKAAVGAAKGAKAAGSRAKDIVKGARQKVARAVASKINHRGRPAPEQGTGFSWIDEYAHLQEPVLFAEPDLVPSEMDPEVQQMADSTHDEDALTPEELAAGVASYLQAFLDRMLGDLEQDPHLFNPSKPTPAQLKMMESKSKHLATFVLLDELTPVPVRDPFPLHDHVFFDGLVVDRELARSAHALESVAATEENVRFADMLPRALVQPDSWFLLDGWPARTNTLGQVETVSAEWALRHPEVPLGRNLPESVDTLVEFDGEDWESYVGKRGHRKGQAAMRHVSGWVVWDDDPRYSKMQAAGQSPETGGLPAVPKETAGADHQKILEAHAHYQGIKAQVPNLTIDQIRDRAASFRDMSQPVLAGVLAREGHAAEGTRERMAAELIENLERLKFRPALAAAPPATPPTLAAPPPRPAAALQPPPVARQSSGSVPDPADRQARRQLAMSQPPGQRGGPNSPLRNVIWDAYTFMRQSTGKTENVLIPAIWLAASRYIPNLTPAEFVKELTSAAAQNHGGGPDGTVRLRPLDNWRGLDRSRDMASMPVVAGKHMGYITWDRPGAQARASFSVDELAEHNQQQQQLQAWLRQGQEGRQRLALLLGPKMAELRSELVRDGNAEALMTLQSLSRATSADYVQQEQELTGRLGLIGGRLLHDAAFGLEDRESYLVPVWVGTLPCAATLERLPLLTLAGMPTPDAGVEFTDIGAAMQPSALLQEAQAARQRVYERYLGRLAILAGKVRLGLAQAATVTFADDSALVHLGGAGADYAGLPLEDRHPERITELLQEGDRIVARQLVSSSFPEEAYDRARPLVLNLFAGLVSTHGFGEAVAAFACGLKACLSSQEVPILVASLLYRAARDQGAVTFCGVPLAALEDLGRRSFGRLLLHWHGAEPALELRDLDVLFANHESAPLAHLLPIGQGADPGTTETAPATQEVRNVSRQWPGYFEQVAFQTLDSSHAGVRQVISQDRISSELVCPHCGEVILEKHLGSREDGQSYHSDCGGTVQLPATDWSTIAGEWRELLQGRETATFSVDEDQLGSIRTGLLANPVIAEAERRWANPLIRTTRQLYSASVPRRPAPESRLAFVSVCASWISDQISRAAVAREDTTSLTQAKALLEKYHNGYDPVLPELFALLPSLVAYASRLLDSQGNPVFAGLLVPQSGPQGQPALNPQGGVVFRRELRQPLAVIEDIVYQPQRVQLQRRLVQTALDPAARSVPGMPQQVLLLHNALFPNAPVLKTLAGQLQSPYHCVWVDPWEMAAELPEWQGWNGVHLLDEALDIAFGMLLPSALAARMHLVVVLPRLRAGGEINRLHHQLRRLGGIVQTVLVQQNSLERTQQVLKEFLGSPFRQGLYLPIGTLLNDIKPRDMARYDQTWSASTSDLQGHPGALLVRVNPPENAADDASDFLVR